MKGIGSGRLEIISHSPNFDVVLQENNDINYTNIELRQSGIIIGVNSVLRRFIWMIPFSRIKIIEETTTFKYADGDSWMSLVSNNKATLYAFNKKIKQQSKL